jgi:hypothetical protein
VLKAVSVAEDPDRQAAIAVSLADDVLRYSVARLETIGAGRQPLAPRSCSCQDYLIQEERSCVLLHMLSYRVRTL